MDCGINTGYCSSKILKGIEYDLKDRCILWDSSCAGNRTLATNEFFNQTRGLFWANECFHDSLPSKCAEYESSQRIS